MDQGTGMGMFLVRTRDTGTHRKDRSTLKHHYTLPVFVFNFILTQDLQVTDLSVVMTKQ